MEGRRTGDEGDDGGGWDSGVVIMPGWMMKAVLQRMNIEEVEEGVGGVTRVMGYEKGLEKEEGKGEESSPLEWSGPPLWGQCCWW